METSTTLGGWNSFKNPKLFEEIKPTSNGNKEWPFLINSHFKQDDDELKNKKCYMTEEEFMIMGAVKKKGSCYSPNLLQNCDLPPPVKVFTGADEIVLNSIKSKASNTSKITNEVEKRDLPRSKSSEENDKVDLMKALQLSQSRARTAEKKASQMAEERDRLSSLFLKESLRLFAHRQWMKLLQLEVSHLQSHKQKNQHQHSCNHCKKKLDRDEGSSDAEDGENAGSLSWYMTLAICLGIAGVGVAVGLGYRYLLL
ncbi:hypothetical protein ACHQM5_023462 [Ranunculus cassubicifolius]